MSDTMRGVETNLARIRRTVFREVAHLAYESKSGDHTWIDELPYEIIPGNVATYRESVFLERAVVGERIRLAMGLPLREPNRRILISEGVEDAARPETYYQPPLINIIPFACNSCVEDAY